MPDYSGPMWVSHNSRYHYSGPGRYEIVKGLPKSHYSGPLKLVYGSGSEPDALIRNAYSGPLRVSNLGGANSFYYFADADWSYWNGPFRTFDDVLYLGYVNVRAVLQIPDAKTVFHYRFGNTQTLFSEPDNSVTAVPALKLEKRADGITGVATTGPDASTWQIVNDTDQQTFRFGGWIKWGDDEDTDPAGTIFGFNHVVYLNANNPSSYYTSVTSRTFYGRVWHLPAQSDYDTPRLKLLFASLEGVGQYYYGNHLNHGQVQFNVPLNVLPFSKGEPHLIDVDFTFSSDTTHKYLTVRLMIDGKLIVISKQTQETGSTDLGYSTFDTNSPLSITPGGVFQPALGGLSQTYPYDWYYNPDPARLPYWGALSFTDPFNSSIDEVYAAHHPMTVASATPMLVINPYYDFWGQDAVVNPSWGTGTERVYDPTRHLPASAPPIDDSPDDNTYTLYGPVHRTNRPDTGGITSVKCTHDADITTGQRVFISIRANTAAFEWGDDTLPWGDWQDLTKYSGQSKKVGGGGYGKYVQVRLRIVPTQDDRRLVSPGISYLELDTSDFGNAGNNKPTAPAQSWMTVDSRDSKTATAVISRYPESPHVFAWSPGDDLDPDDVPILSYQFQIASRSDFARDPVSGVSSILYDVSNVEGNVLDLPVELISGTYFWRVRTFDDKAFSPWSDLGFVQVNVPPNAPYGLAVYQTL